MSFCVLFSVLFVATQSKLVSVNVISIGCDRAPLQNFVIKPKPIVDWMKYLGVSTGELTSLGMTQCYELGSTLRENYLDPSSDNYIEGISQAFKSYNYSFFSPGEDRMIQELVSIGHGLFPQSHKGISPRIDILPMEKQDYCLPHGSTVIPIHSEFLFDDVFLNSEEICPNFQTTAESYFKSKAWKELEESTEVQKQFKNVVSSLELDDSFQLKDIFLVYDVVSVMKNHFIYNVSEEVFSDLQALNSLVFENKYQSTNVKRLISGNLMSLVKKNILEKKEEDQELGYIHYMIDRGLFLSILSSLKLNVDYPSIYNYPTEGSSIIFEVHDNDGDYFVETAFLNSFDGTFKYLLYPKYCNEDVLCPIAEFQTMVNQIIPIDWFNWCEGCNNNDADVCILEMVNVLKRHNIICWVLIAIIAFIILVLVVFFPVMLIKKYVRKKESQNYKYMP